MKNRKRSQVLDEILTRHDYLVVQGNDLAKAFGNLKAFEHKLLDYCFSFVQKDSQPETRFELETAALLKSLNLTSSGTNYERVVKGFKALNENTAIYIPVLEPDGSKSLMMTQLFSFIKYNETGKIQFEFSKYAQPHVFDLKNNFYSFHLRELAQMKGKYALILLKLWESHRYGNSDFTLIQGSMDEWQQWFLGDKKRLSAGAFKQKVLSVAIKEVEEKLRTEITLITHKKGRTITGYEMEIRDLKRHSPNLEFANLR